MVSLQQVGITPKDRALAAKQLVSDKPTRVWQIWLHGLKLCPTSHRAVLMTPTWGVERAT